MADKNEVAYWLDRLSYKGQLGRGLVYAVSIPVFTLASGSSRFIGLVTGVEPVVLHSFSAQTQSTRSALIKTFIGGTLTGGTPVTVYPQNHYRQLPAPPIAVTDDQTVSVGGTQIGEFFFGDGVQDVSQENAAVFAPNQSYYVEFENTSNQSLDDVRVGVVFGAMV